MGAANIVSSAFWTRGSGVRLRGDADALAVAGYLMTCPGANYIGLFHLALPTMCHETGIPAERVRPALERIAAAGFAHYDEEAELAWIPNTAELRIGPTMAPKDKKRAMVQRDLAALGKHRFVRQFLTRYGVAYGLIPSPADAPSARADATISSPLISSDPITRAPVRDQVSDPEDGSDTTEAGHEQGIHGAHAERRGESEGGGDCAGARRVPRGAPDSLPTGPGALDCPDEARGGQLLREESHGIGPGERQPEHVAELAVDAPLPPEWHEFARILGLADVELVWAKFTGHFVGKRWTPTEAYGRWRKWVADELPKQRAAREREREAKASRAGPVAAQPRVVGRKDDERWRRERADATPMPGDFMAVLGP